MLKSLSRSLAGPGHGVRVQVREVHGWRFIRPSDAGPAGRGEGRGRGHTANLGPEGRPGIRGGGPQKVKVSSGEQEVGEDRDRHHHDQQGGAAEDGGALLVQCAVAV